MSRFVFRAGLPEISWEVFNVLVNSGWEPLQLNIQKPNNTALFIQSVFACDNKQMRRMCLLSAYSHKHISGSTSKWSSCLTITQKKHSLSVKSLAQSASHWKGNKELGGGGWLRGLQSEGNSKENRNSTLICSPRSEVGFSHSRD